MFPCHQFFGSVDAQASSPENKKMPLLRLGLFYFKFYSYTGYFRWYFKSKLTFLGLPWLSKT